MKNSLKVLMPAEAVSKLKNMLAKKRFIHSLGVAKAAGEIASKYDLDIKKAVLAGLLHDCARDLSPAKCTYYIKKYRMKFDAVSEKNPELWHSYLGPYVAAEVFGVNNREIFDAIKHHTAGDLTMGQLAKAVYVADYAEPNRKYKASAEIRKKIKTKISLDELLKHVLKGKLSYLIEEGKLIHQDSVDMWNHYNRKL